MKTTFNKLVRKSRDAIDIIDSHALKNLMDKDEDLTIIDVNDKEETDKRGMITVSYTHLTLPTILLV